MANLKMLRKQICEERAKLTPDFQQKAAEKVANIICQLDVFKNNQHIVAYISVNGEIDLSLVLQCAWDQGKICYLPVLTRDKKLLFSVYNEGDPLLNNRHGIAEPYVEPDKLINSEDLDVVITPLVGFDVDGNRLGKGSGCYDRTFAFTKKRPRGQKPCLIGVAYEFQNLSQFDSEPWDVPLDIIVTEIQLRDFTGRSNRG